MKGFRILLHGTMIASLAAIPGRLLAEPRYANQARAQEYDQPPMQPLPPLGGPMEGEPSPSDVAPSTSHQNGPARRAPLPGEPYREGSLPYPMLDMPPGPMGMDPHAMGYDYGPLPDSGDCWIGRPWAPTMLGDFFVGRTGGITGTVPLDRLLVRVPDLTAPNPLPAAGAPLTITEPGPIGVFTNVLPSIQTTQLALRSGLTIPPPLLVRPINQNGTVTTQFTVAEIQLLLASTPNLGFDIIPVVAPPAGYATEVNAAFEQRNQPGGETVYRDDLSGAFLEGGADTLAPGQDLVALYYYDYQFRLNLNSPSAGAFGAGALKFADNGSLLPQDRVFVDGASFDDVVLLPNGVTVTRYTPGFELAFLGGEASVEMRLPFASTVDADIFVGPGGVTNTDEVEFGNIAIYLKMLAYYDEQVAIGAGLGITTPSADDVQVLLPNGTPLVHIENDGVHIQPFVGAVINPTPRIFAQSIIQWDIVASGNPVLMQTGTGFNQVGVLTDASYLFTDVSAGYWLYRPDTFADAQVSGVAALAELHYNMSLDDTDIVTNGNLQIGDGSGDIDIVNVTLGGVVEIGRNTTVSAGYVRPITDAPDRQFQEGFRVMVNHYPLGRY